MEKRNNIKFKKVSETYSDCTSNYEVSFDGDLQFDEFTRYIKDNLSNEWGKINIVGHKIKITYKNGVFKCTESEIPLDELLNSKIESIKCHGGWSNMDYFIKIIDNRLEQKTKMSNDFIEMFKPYSFKNWHGELFYVSSPYHEVVIPVTELKQLVENSHLYTNDETLSDFTFYKNLKNLIKNKFDGKEFFAKFFTRSPKDIKVIFNNAYELIDSFLNSMRTFEDMIVVRHATKDIDQLVIYLRPVIEFNKKNEYRLFYVNGFISVCNYHKQDSKEIHTEIVDKDIVYWNDEFIKRYTGIDNYCIDFIKHDDGRFELIEINPYYLSDPILLDHTKLNLMNKQITYER